MLARSDLKILIAEDDFIINMFIEQVLIGGGYQVVAVVSRGDEAIAKTRELNPGLLLMDIGLLGKLNGIDTAMLIRQESEVPIVFMTGNTDLVKNDTRIGLIRPLATLLKPIDDVRILEQMANLFPQYI